MTIDFDAIEDLIQASRYGSIKRFFEDSSIGMTAQNYYKLKRTTGRMKGNYLEVFCKELNCKLSDITNGFVVHETGGSYTTLKNENELLRDLIEEKDEIIALLREKLDTLK